MTNEVNADLVVLGGGPGGYAAAFYAADLGLKVALVDVETNPGGVCLYRGCIPSKALLHVAKLIREAEHAKAWGIDFGKPAINVDKLHAFKEGVVKKLTGGLGQLSKARKIEYVQGRGSFENATTMRVSLNAGGEKVIKFKNAVIAAGSRPATLPNFPAESPYLLNSTTALDIVGVPKKFLVVGGGYIGLELGSVYAALGSEVTVVEVAPGLMMGADRDMVAILEKKLKSEFANIYTDTKVVSVKEEAKGLRIQFEGKNVKEPEVVFDKVLVSVGRKPNSSGLGLNNTKVEVDERGFIKIAPDCRTAEPNIFAIGDIVGGMMLAHKASHEARVAVDAAMGKRVAFQPQAIPAVVFTDPEIAWAGVTEDEAKKQGLNVEVVKFPWAASGRALTIDRVDGLTKIIVDKTSERILGVGIIGANAGDLISEGVLAIEMGATAADLSLTIHPHPTLSETIMEAAELFFGHCTHMYRPKKA